MRIQKYPDTCGRDLSDIEIFVARRAIFSHQRKNSGVSREKTDNLYMKEFVKKRLNLAEALPTQNILLNV